MLFPTVYKTKMSGLKKLDDRDVAFCRKFVDRYSIKHLAKRFGVSYSAMYNAIKGNTFKHLNGEFPPQW